MNSSGIKRGLATTAITALAITGLPFLATSASADTIENAVGENEVSLFTQYSGAGSVQFDGTNRTVHLLAGGGAGVVEVRFEYVDETDGTVEIATVIGNDGVFSYEWAPPTAIYNDNITIRAVALDESGAEIDSDETVEGVQETADEQATVVGGAESAVNIDAASASDLNVFQQPYGGDQNRLLGAVSGTTSDVSEAEVVASNLTSGVPTGDTAGIDGEYSEPANGLRDFTAPVDFSGYVLDDEAPLVNEAVVGVELGSDDAEVVNLVSQEIDGVTAEAADASVPEGGTTDGLVTVVDENGEPVVGARVVLEQGNVAEFTDVNGVATFENLSANEDGESYSVYVDTTAQVGYQSSVDFRRTFTVGSFEQESNLSIESNDGDAFDSDEYQNGDLTVTAQDQFGNDLPDGTVVSYTIEFTPEATEEDPTPESDTTSATALVTDGEATIAVPQEYLNQNGTYVVNAFIDQDGTPGQGANDPSADEYTFTAGESTLEFIGAGEDDSVAPAGETSTFTAELVLFDGTPLAGRDVRFNLNQAGSDVIVAPQASQPAGTTRLANTVAEDTTDANGAVQVAVTDPDNDPAESELNVVLNATTVNTEDLGDADEDGSVTIDFINAEGPEGTTVEITEDNTTGTPGLVTEGTVTVEAPIDEDPEDTAPVENLLVTLTVSGDAFFTDGTPAEEDQEVGDLDGDLTNLGQTITVVTDENGEADYGISIGQSDDFNDDGEATVEVTATASGDTDTEDYDFSTENPLNGGDVEVVLAPAQFQESSIAPRAPLTDDVAYDVTVTDQFGNPVGDVEVEADADGVGTVVRGPSGDLTTDFTPNAEFYVSATTAGSSTPTVSWNAPVNVVGADDENVIEADGPTATFYAVDFANSTFTLSQQGADTVPVGSTVIMTYTAIDQNGEPIELSDVDFLRAGPGDAQDDTSNGDSNPTGEDGKVNYVFQGASAGVANITAIGYLNGEVIPESQASDTVTFGGTTGPETLRPKLSANNNGAKADRLNLTTGKAIAEGAVAKFFRIKADGSSVQVGRGVLNENGQVKVNVKDVNGKKFSRYFAKIMKTEDTKFAKSKNTRVR